MLSDHSAELSSWGALTYTFHTFGRSSNCCWYIPLGAHLIITGETWRFLSHVQLQILWFSLTWLMLFTLLSVPAVEKGGKILNTNCLWVKAYRKEPQEWDSMSQVPLMPVGSRYLNGGSWTHIFLLCGSHWVLCTVYAVCECMSVCVCVCVCVGGWMSVRNTPGKRTFKCSETKALTQALRWS